jgi:hypothetical protein
MRANTNHAFLLCLFIIMLARSRRLNPAYGAALCAVEGTRAKAEPGRFMRRPKEGPRLPQPGPARSRTFKG